MGKPSVSIGEMTTESVVKENKYNGIEENGNNGSKDALYKTELCLRYSETGSCRYGEKCQFAHGIQELRQVQRHPKYKTTKCKSFWGPTGRCPYGSRCRFIHEEPEFMTFQTGSMNRTKHESVNLLLPSWSMQNAVPVASPPLSVRECKHIAHLQPTVSVSANGSTFYRAGYQMWRSRHAEIKNSSPCETWQNSEPCEEQDSILSNSEESQIQVPLYMRECRHLESNSLPSNREEDSLYSNFASMTLNENSSSSSSSSSMDTPINPNPSHSLYSNNLVPSASNEFADINEAHEYRLQYHSWRRQFVL